MRLPRVRFSVRWLLAAVAVAGLAFASVASLTRRAPKWRDTPRDALAALEWLGREWAIPRGYDDIAVRRLRPAESVGGQHGATFLVTLTRRGAPGVPAERRRFLIFEGGYCLQLAGEPPAEPGPPEPK